MSKNKVIIREIDENIYILRVNDYNIKYFESLWEIPEGITYNAYLLNLEEEAVLIDLWKRDFSKEFINAIESIVEIEKIRYIIVNHAEPDHTGSLPEILKRNSKAIILGHPLTKTLLENLHNIRIDKFKPVRDGEVLKLNGETLKFLHTPWLHWPETIMTFLENKKILLSCDAFGGYSIPDVIFDYELEDLNNYLQYVRKYFVTVIGHYRAFITKNVEKIRKLDVKLIAPGHGLIWVKEPSKIVKYYLELAKGTFKEHKATIIYGSMYGSVEKAVNKTIKVLREKGFNVKVYKFTDKETASLSEILSDTIDSEIIVIGGATYEVGVFPKIRYVAEMLKHKVSMEKKVLIISSYGWGGIAGKKLSKILSEGGFKIVKVIEFKGMPKDEDLEKIKETLNELIG